MIDISCINKIRLTSFVSHCVNSPIYYNNGYSKIFFSMQTLSNEMAVEMANTLRYISPMCVLVILPGKKCPFKGCSF